MTRCARFRLRQPVVTFTLIGLRGAITCTLIQPMHNAGVSAFNFAKATLVCGSIAYFVYSFPVLSQVIIIAILSLLWLTYLHSTVSRLRHH